MESRIFEEYCHSTAHGIKKILSWKWRSALTSVVSLSLKALVFMILLTHEVVLMNQEIYKIDIEQQYERIVTNPQ